MPEPAPPSRSTFGPVVLLGLVAAGAGAVASTHAWREPETTRAVPGAEALVGAQVPLATSLALVLLACWGVVLVTRGRLRRATAWLGVLTAAGLATTTVWGWWAAHSAVTQAYESIGVTGVTSGPTGWYWLALGSGPVALLAAVIAARSVGSWPEMGARYDAPGRAPAQSSEETTARDLWKAMDEGRDPTHGQI